MVQTTYNVIPAVALVGQHADSAIVKDDVSRVNQESSAIPFGIGVVVGNSTEEARLPTTVNDVFLGVVLREFNHDNMDLAGIGAIPTKDTMSVRKRGRIWVLFETAGGAAAEGGAVFMRISAGGTGGLLTQQGAFSAADDAVTAGSTVRVKNARWAGPNVGTMALMELLGPSDTPSLAAT